MPRDKVRPPAGNRRAEGDGVNVNSILPPKADIPLVPPRGPEAHKEMARRLGIRRNSAKELIVLAPDNDPFYKGTPAHVRDAEWFADIWERFGYERDVHLRRVHYRILPSGLALPDGRPYENTESCWCQLCIASAAARILGLVDVEAIVDHRNDDPVINATARQVPFSAPQVWRSHGSSLRLPWLDLGAFSDVEASVGSPYVSAMTTMRVISRR
jgi:hypothetical protein